MFKNYLKIAWRNLVKNRAHSAINISGLSVGMVCSFLIVLWVHSEKSVDAYHKNGSLLYQVYEREYDNNKATGDYDTPGLMAEELKKELPEIKYAAATEEGSSQSTFKAGNKTLKMNGLFAGEDLFKMFSYPLLQGSAQAALNAPVNIAISKKMAVSFFGGAAAAMGKTIRYNDSKDFIVTAVFDEPPENSSISFDFVINWKAYLLKYPGQSNWSNSGSYTYVMLQPGANAVQTEKKVRHFLDRFNKPSASFRVEYGLQRFDQVYLHSHFTNGQIDGGRIEYVHIFSIIAVFVLLIACVNFMNLSTAQSVNRAKEIGVRKVIGAVRKVLIRQFIGESLMLTTVAAIIALILLYLVLPGFNNITQKQIAVPFGKVSFWLETGLLVLVTGIISGSYPALFLSSFNPVKVLKGSTKMSIGALWFRKGLVVFQFALSAILITGTIIISKQVNYIQTKDIGYDRENLVYVPIEGDLGKQYDAFKNSALNTPGVLAVTESGESPTFVDDATSAVSWEGKDPNAVTPFAFFAVGYDFVKTMKVTLISGRDFSKDFPSDSNNYIINETAKDLIGYAHPVGRTFTQWGVKGKIVGLVKDFQMQSLHEKIQPLVLRLIGKNRQDGDVLIRVAPNRTRQVLAGIKGLCAQLNPNFPFTYAFSDQEYLKLYKSEEVVGRLSNIFAFLAIFISCLGLLGLAMFTVSQRIKEIGIRKILGASVTSVFTLLSAEFLTLVSIALLIATPVAWYALKGWLQGYAYHTPVQWWLFAVSGGVTLVIALLTVSYQTIKAALMNPVKSLKAE